MIDPNISLKELGVGSQERYKAVFSSIATGKIMQCSEAQLTEHLAALSQRHVENVGQDQTAAALLIHNLLLAKAVARVSESASKAK